jgi:outer membrane lipoprotein SlyB
METTTQGSKSPHPLMWVAAIALIVFCGAGFAAIMGWIPTSMGNQPDAAALAAAEKAKAAPVKAVPAKVAEAPHEKVWRDRPSQAPAPAVVAAARCAECGVIQSVRAVESKGAGSGVGAAGGAVVGGVLGHQVGHGDGNTIATVLGAVGGAVAGNEIEKRVKTSKSYEITVRFDDGSSRMFTEANAPTWRSGDKVKVVNGVIQSNA